MNLEDGPARMASQRTAAFVAMFVACTPQPNESVGDSGEESSTSGGTEGKTDESGSNSDAGSETDSGTSACDGEKVHSGDLLIDDGTDSDDIRCLEAVLGALRIENTSGWTDMRWLGNLRQVDGDLDIDRNISLVSLTGLEQLETLGGHLSIIGNPALTNIRGLSGVKTLTGLSIGHNPSLTDLTSLQGEVRIGRAPGYGWRLAIGDNESLATFAGLGAIKTVLTDGPFVMSFQRNGELRDLEGLDSFARSGQEIHLDLYDNPKLESLGVSFTSLSQAQLGFLPSLTSLAGIDDEDIDTLVLNGLDSLTSLHGLENVQKIRYLEIGPCLSGNASLTTLAGLDNLSSVSFLSILDHPALTNIAALDGVTGSLSWLWIVRNLELPQIDVDSFANRFSVPSHAILLCGNQGGPPCDSSYFDTCPPQGEFPGGPSQQVTP